MWSWVNVSLFPLMTFLTSGQITTAIRVSAPEDHRLYLHCGLHGDVVWSHQDRGVIAARRGGESTNRQPRKYDLLPDGSLYIDELEASDSGEYRCNDQLVADLQVLTGQPYCVSAGQVLLLPCRGSSKPKQRWSFRRRGQTRRQTIATRYKNGTVAKERADPGERFSYSHDALQILRLAPADAGEYQCNTGTAVRVTVLEANPDHSTSTQSSTTTALMKIDVVENEDEERTHRNALLMVAIIGLCATVIVAGVKCLLIVMYRRKGAYSNRDLREEHTELQTWSLSSTGGETLQSDRDTTVPQMEELHYASLGRQNWRDRPRVLGDQQNQVIYSSVVTRPTQSSG